MSDYEKLLEAQNEELKEALAKLQYEHQAWTNALTPYWTEVNTRAKLGASPGNQYVCRYTTGLFSICEILLLPHKPHYGVMLTSPQSDWGVNNFETIEEAKAWAEKTYFNYIAQHHDKKQWGNLDWRI